MKLITETALTEGFRFLTESSSDNQPMYIIEGVYAQADTKNGNGRIYKYKDLKSEVDRFRTEMIETGRALGELEHPSYPEINPKKAAIRILSMDEDNKNWIGRSVILCSFPERNIRGTPEGDILLGLCQYGTQMGFSTRAVGEVSDNGIVTDLKLCAIDCVANPSIGIFCKNNADRFVNGILESKDFVLNNHGDVVENLEGSYNKLESKLAKMPKTNISAKKSKYLGDAITSFFNSIVE